MKKTLLFLSLATLAVTACQKNNNIAETKPLQQIALADVRFMTTNVVGPGGGVGETGGSNKDEGSCVIDNKIGTKCFESVGNSCSKVHACEAVANQARSGMFTRQEIDHTIALTKATYNVEYVYDVNAKK